MQGVESPYIEIANGFSLSLGPDSDYILIFFDYIAVRLLFTQVLWCDPQFTVRETVEPAPVA